MDEHDDDSLVDGDQVKEVDSGEDQKNLLELIRAKRRELTENRSCFISIPGYEEIGLVAKYHLLDGKELDMIADKVKRQTRNRVDRGLFAAADTLIECCDGLYIAKDENVFEALDPDKRGTPLAYEPALGAFIGAVGADTARKVVFALFGENDSALAAHTMKLNRWFANTNRDADEDFLGEV